MHGMFGNTRVGLALHGEHRSTLAALDDLAQLCRPTAAPDLGKADTRARLEDLARVLEDDVTSHFGFEEEHLFPRLRQAGAGFMVDMLLGEHQVIRPLAEQVRDRALAAVRDGGFSAEDWATFRRAGQELVDRETFHVQKEEMGLLAALAQVLDPEADAELTARHEARKG